MLNKKEKMEVCDTIARWEWMQGGSVSEATAYGACASKIKNLFHITNDDSDLVFSRAYELQQLIIPFAPDAIEDDFFDVLCTMLEYEYQQTLDLCESRNFEELLTVVRGRI